MLLPDGQLTVRTYGCSSAAHAPNSLQQQESLPFHSWGWKGYLPMRQPQVTALFVKKGMWSVGQGGPSSAAPWGRGAAQRPFCASLRQAEPSSPSRFWKISIGWSLKAEKKAQ